MTFCFILGQTATFYFTNDHDDDDVFIGWNVSTESQISLRGDLQLENSF